MKKVLIIILIIVLTTMTTAAWPAAASKGSVGLNVVLNTDITDLILAELGSHGQIFDVIPEIDALTMKVKTTEVAAIKALPYVAAANPDVSRNGAPIDTVAVTDFNDGLSTWNLDLINVTDFGFDNRKVAQDGSGVYVAVLDTGLLDSWRKYFPDERIATEYARSFSGGPNEVSKVAEQPNKWEHDQNSHGTHVTSTILGYDMLGTPVNGVAPKATVIPVKVLNQNGSGWSSVIARGIVYVAELKAGPLNDHPVVINMSLGGSVLDAVEKAAIDYAIEQGVIIVASAGNNGDLGMGYPGAYEPVISVAAAGWAGEWLSGSWWYAINAAEPTNPAHLYITEFSARPKSNPVQDLDVAAPGSWIVGPYQVNSGKTSYYFLGGTSMASPHVAGVVALMAEKCPTLTAADAEDILESTALDLSLDELQVNTPSGPVTYTWPESAEGHGLVQADAALAATP